MGKSETVSQASELQVVDFKLGEEDFAIDINFINEIISYREPRPVPQAPEFIEGVVDLRGMVVPVIDLNRRLGIPRESSKSFNHILVIKMNDMIIGISVEKVMEVTQINIEKVQEAQKILKRGNIQYLKGFCKISGRLVLLVDVTGIVSHDEKELLEVVL